jgi:hypothetical protein
MDPRWHSVPSQTASSGSGGGGDSVVVMVVGFWQWNRGAMVVAL